MTSTPPQQNDLIIQHQQQSSSSLSDREQLEALKQRLTTWKQSAKQQLEDAQRKNESLRRQLDSVTAERDSLRSKEEDRSIASDALVARAVSLQEKLSASDSRLVEEQKTFAVLKKQHADQVRSLEDQVTSLRQEQTKLYETIKEKEKAVNHSNNNNSQKTKNTSSHEENNVADGENDELLGNNHDADGQENEEAGTSSTSSDHVSSLLDNDAENFRTIFNTFSQLQGETNSSSSSTATKKALQELKSRFILLQQQIDERDCRIAVLNSLYSQVKAEASNASTAIGGIREEHARTVDQLRSSIATMTVQVASKSSAHENLRRQQEELTKRVKWSEDEVRRLRDDAAERERAYEEMFQQNQHQIQTSLDNMSKNKNQNNNNNNNGENRNERRTGDKENSAAAEGDKTMQQSEDLDRDQNQQQEKIIKNLRENLDQANNSLALKDQKSRHLETRVEEQQTMIRQLAKQLSDANMNNSNNHNSISSRTNNNNGILIADEDDADDNLEDKFHSSSSSSPSKYDGTSSSSKKSSSSFAKETMEWIMFSFENGKNQLQRLLNRYRVLAPLFLGITLLIFFMIWFSRGSGPTANRVDMFSKRTEQLEQELNAVREAYSRLNIKCNSNTPQDKKEKKD